MAKKGGDWKDFDRLNEDAGLIDVPGSSQGSADVSSSEEPAEFFLLRRIRTSLRGPAVPCLAVFNVRGVLKPLSAGFLKG